MVGEDGKNILAHRFAFEFVTQFLMGLLWTIFAEIGLV